VKSFLLSLRTFVVRTIFCIGLVAVITGAISIAGYIQNPDRVNSHIKNWFMEEESVTSTVTFPNNEGELVFTVIPLHPFLSEFKYIARVKMKDGRKFKQTLEIQTGGEPNVRILYMENPNAKKYLGFDHHSGQTHLFEVIDLSDGSLKQFESLNEARKKFQILDDTKVRNLGWITESNMKLE
jgi:hypothetical protein